MKVMQPALIKVTALKSGTKPIVHEDAPGLHPRQVAAVEPEDLARFEGEGGLEAPEPAARPPKN